MYELIRMEKSVEQAFAVLPVKAKILPSSSKTTRLYWCS